MTTATSREGRTTAGAWVAGAFIYWCLSFAGMAPVRTVRLAGK